MTLVIKKKTDIYSIDKANILSEMSISVSTFEFGLKL